MSIVTSGIRSVVQSDVYYMYFVLFVIYHCIAYILDCWNLHGSKCDGLG